MRVCIGLNLQIFSKPFVGRGADATIVKSVPKFACYSYPCRMISSIVIAALAASVAGTCRYASNVPKSCAFYCPSTVSEFDASYTFERISDWRPSQSIVGTV